MFPHPCSEKLRNQVAAGADPRTVVPDDFVVVKGGTKPVPNLGTKFSCSCGPTLDDAACGVPHNQLQLTTAGEIRAHGGEVYWVPEYSHRGTINEQHVNVTEMGLSSFGIIQPNPTVKNDRIDRGR